MIERKYTTSSSIAKSWTNDKHDSVRYRSRRPLIQASDERFLNVKQLAHFLAVAEPTVRDWIKYKTIPFVKMGKLIRFDKFEIELWLRTKQKGGVT